MKRPHPHHHIQRVEAPYPHWQVYIERQRRLYKKCFSDGRYGGKRAALRLAVAHRDRVLAIAPPPSVARSTNTLNTSGSIGVSRSRYRTKRGYLVITWTAYCTVRGRLTKRSFSVRKYGEVKAKAMAIEARRNAVDEILQWHGEPPSTIPHKNIGVPGVSLRRTRAADGRTLFSYAASWIAPDGTPRHRSFSVAKYGDRKARALAIKTRRFARKRKRP